MKRAKPLYGQSVCKKCYYKFANRRQGAFIIDFILLRVLETVFSVLLLSLALDGTLSEPWYNTAVIFLTFVALGLLLVKDGFGGYSPGKLITGVQVVDETNLEPAGIVHSLKRNLPILIPFVPLFIAYQLQKGHRLGDKWSRSRVIWRKYRHNPVFTGAPIAITKDEFLPEIDAEIRPASSNPYSAPIDS